VVFAGVFWKNGCFGVVFCWSSCGEMRGKDGDLTVTFPGRKNTPTILNLFSRIFRLGRVATHPKRKSAEGELSQRPADLISFRGAYMSFVAVRSDWKGLFSSITH
jgi:hypothetical protein